MRTDFRVLAHWQGRVRVGASGRVSTALSLPQSLSTYRLIAVASSGATQFGTGEHTIEIAQPFLVQPALPRFVAIGDTFEAGAVLQNQAGAPGKATLQLQLPADAPVALDGPASQTIDLPVGPKEVRFRLLARRVGAVSLTMQATLDVAGRREADAVKVGLPVTITRRLETVAAAGAVKAGGSPAIEQVRLPAGVNPDLGGLDVQASSSALAGLQNGVRYLVEYPYGCLEQRSSRVRSLLALADLQQAFPLRELAGTKLRDTVLAEIERIPSYEVSSGGLSYWPGGEVPDVYLSARALILLLDARDLGYPVSAVLVGRLVAYLESVVAQETELSEARPDNDSDGIWLNRAHVLYALARAGQPDREGNAQVYDQRQQLNTLERVHLLHAMLEAGETGERPRTLYGELRNSLRIEADQAFLQDDDADLDWVCPCLRYLFASDVHDTAAFLSLMTLIDADDPLNAQMARWLLAQRKNGMWANTLENGYALSALVAFYRAAEPAAPQFRAEVAVGAVSAFRGAFTGRTLDVQSGSVPFRQLRGAFGDPAKAVPLTVSATGTGTLYWSARLRYAPELRTLRSLDAGMSVTRRYRPVRDGAVGGPATTFAAGDVVQVELTVTTKQVHRQVVIDDPIPAGFEVLNDELATTAESELRARGVSGADAGVSGSEGIDHTEVHDDRVLLFATSLRPGTITYAYLARATAPGTFAAAPTQAEEMYRPEIFGRTATATVTVTPPRR